MKEVRGRKLIPTSVSRGLRKKNTSLAVGKEVWMQLGQR
jgi:hypothetical protein